MGEEAEISENPENLRDLWIDFIVRGIPRSNCTL
jgi:hypothetical protein